MKNKKMNNSKIFMGILSLVLVFLLFCVVLILLRTDTDNGDRENNPSAELATSNERVDFAVYFPECNLLSSNCLNADCDQYFLCNDKEYLRCEVYDCGEEFGIGTKDKDGKVDILPREAKDNKEKIVEVKSRCSGTVEIVKSDCKDEKLKMTIKVATNGDCKIEGFLVGYRDQEGGGETNFKPAEFSDLDSGVYAVSVNSCNEVLEIIAIGENGVSIK